MGNKYYITMTKKVISFHTRIPPLQQNGKTYAFLNCTTFVYFFSCLPYFHFENWHSRKQRPRVHVCSNRETIGARTTWLIILVAWVKYGLYWRIGTYWIFFSGNTWKKIWKTTGYGSAKKNESGLKLWYRTNSRDVICLCFVQFWGANLLLLLLGV